MSDIHRMLLSSPSMVYIPDTGNEIFMLHADRPQEGLILVVGDFSLLDRNDAGAVAEVILRASAEGRAHFILAEEMS